ncbi:HDIG domain-containing protein [candidate division WOR-3 bacterium]|nr:HDIG domain-containing protein [candidate division WOR-3 bacterium]
MNRKEALGLVNSMIKTKNLIKHSLAVESGMRELAKHFSEDEELWELAGLLHDLDYEETKDDFSKHGLRTAEILKEKVDEKILYAIKAHSGKTEPKSKLDIALYAIDPLTGLIVAACLMHPEKKLEYLNKDFILRRFKEKRFAAGANREQIKTCTKLGIELEEFIDLVLRSMQKIHKELSL